MILTIKPNDPALVRNALGLLGVADGAFKNREDIEKVVIEEGVGFVGEWAFDKCRNLVEVVLPESMLMLGNRAFSFCHKLEYITLPRELMRVSPDAFRYCMDFMCLRFRGPVDETMKKVCHGMFPSEGLSYLSADGRMLYSAEADDDEEIHVPDGVERIAEKAFWGDDYVTEVFLPDSVREIGAQAFQGCSSLERIKIQGDENVLADAVFPEGVEVVRTGPGCLRATEWSVAQFAAEQSDENYHQAVKDFVFEVMVTNRHAWFPASASALAQQLSEPKAPVGMGIVRDQNGLPFLVFLTSDKISTGTYDAAAEMVASTVFTNAVPDPGLAGVAINPWTDGGVLIPKPDLMSAIQEIGQRVS